VRVFEAHLAVVAPDRLYRGFENVLDAHGLALALVGKRDGQVAGLQPARHEPGENLPGAARLAGKDGLQGAALDGPGGGVDVDGLGPAALDHHPWRVAGDEDAETAEGDLAIGAVLETDPPLEEATLGIAQVLVREMGPAQQRAVAVLEQQAFGPPRRCVPHRASPMIVYRVG